MYHFRTVAALQVPLTHTYFCLPQQNPNEQFFYFTSIFTFLLNQASITFSNPGQFDDPNAVSSSLGIVNHLCYLTPSVEELRKIGFVTDFPPSKLKQGYGDTVCTVLNGLADYTLEKKNFKFKKPNYPETRPEDDFDEGGEEESMVVDETMVDDGQNDETLNEDAFEDFGAPVNKE
jgi:estrogen-related receptor beta like 1